MNDFDDIRTAWLATRSVEETAYICGVSIQVAYVVIRHVEREQGR